MKAFKAVLRVSAYSFRKLLTNYRLWLAVLMLLILTHIYTKDYGLFCDTVDMKLSPWIFPFLYNAKYLKILFFAPLLLLFCDAPFIDNSQPYVICRSGRVIWSIGQLLYIVILSALYFIFLFLISCLFVSNHIEFSLEWGRVLNTLASTGAGYATGLMPHISSRIMFYFTPLQATWFTFLLSWLSGIFLGLIIYAVNSLTGGRSLGIILASSFVVLDSAAGMYHSTAYLSPVSWSNLDYIDIGGLSAYPSITYIFCAFAVILIVLIAISIVANKKQTISVMQPV